MLYGGSGADTLFGGNGNDRFIFLVVASTPAAPDFIGDFVKGQDVIDLGSIDTNSTMGGDQAFSFAGANAATIARSVTWYEDAGATNVQADTTGNTTPDLPIVLQGVGLGLTASDFVL